LKLINDDMTDNSLSDYLFSRKNELAELLANNGIQASEKQIDALLKFMLEDPDGIYVADEARVLFGVSFEQAARIEDQVYQAIVLPEYEQFFHHSRELRKRNEYAMVTQTQSKTGVISRTSGNPQLGGTEKGSKARFYFSPEDEEEIRKIVAETALRDDNWSNQREAMDKVYNRIAEKVVDQIEGDQGKTGT